MSEYDCYILEDFFELNFGEGDWDFCGVVKNLEDAEAWVAQASWKRRYRGKNYLQINE